MTDTPRMRVLVADDHMLILEGIVEALSSKYEIVGTSTNGRKLVQDARFHRPDLILLDIGMPEMNGLEAARKLQELLPEVRIIFVTQQTHPAYIRAAFETGAYGYVSKEAPTSELGIALKLASRGQFYISPALRNSFEFFQGRRRKKGNIRLQNGLTSRQEEVLKLVAQGRTAREIACVLQITQKTVEFHKRGLMEQTGMHSIAGLTRFAIAGGIISSDSPQ